MKKIKHIGVFTSGGDSPGMNACIRSVVRTGIYHELKVSGIYRGYEGMIEGDLVNLDRKDVANVIQRGGTFLKTARSEAFRTVEGRAKAYEQLRTNEIDALVCIGGNGSFTGAMKLNEEHGIPCVGLPGTIDNDLYGTDYTIGYDTAVNTALEAIDRIRDTAHSHERVFIVEVMGRDSGFIALDVAIAGGAEGALIPEDLEDLEYVLRQFRGEGRRKKSFSLIVVAEGDEQGGALILERQLKEMYPELKVRSTILGHVQRGGRPTARDRILASELGAEAIACLLRGEASVAIGVQNSQFSFTPFAEAISSRKAIPQHLIELARILAI